MLSFFQPRIYIQISPHLLTLKNVKTGKIIAVSNPAEATK